MKYNKTIVDYCVIGYDVDIHRWIPILTTAITSVNIGIFGGYHVISNNTIVNFYISTASPQMNHYIRDGFIASWTRSNKQPIEMRLLGVPTSTPSNNVACLLLFTSYRHDVERGVLAVPKPDIILNFRKTSQVS